ncbi:MAG: right-handed parallel beta-helix repeat-containing protein, partial [Dehalococcoidia bacterium]
GLSRTLTVSTIGNDVVGGSPNSACGPDLTAGQMATPPNPGPCLTIGNALTFARDGDTITVEAGIYEICSTMQITSLVRITGNGNKVILHSYTGDTVFHVTAVGAGVGPASISNHAAIDGFAIGGAFKPAAAAIFLDNDAYTDVTNNVLGGDPLNNTAFTGAPCANPPSAQVQKQEVFGNAASIILHNSDHSNISNNSILGSAIFEFAPFLAVGQVLTGFGIVTTECLGVAADASDFVTIASNLIDRNTNAGIWLCSGGGGLHNINHDVVRNNGRGIVLRAITDSILDSLTVSNDFLDGIVIYDAASNDKVTNDTIESHSTPGSAAIRIGGFGASIQPLAITVDHATILRSATGLVISGARNTQVTNSVITAEDNRTAVLIQIGSAGAPTVTQPVGTGLKTDQIIYNGGCRADAGCAIRLDQLVTTNVDATGTTFGLDPTTDPNTVLWHKPNDASLGYINAGQTFGTPTQATPGPTATATVTFNPTATGTPGPGGSPVVPPGVAAEGTPTPTPTTNGFSFTGRTTTSPALNGGAPGGSTSYTPTCNFVTVQPADGHSVSTVTFLSLFQPVGNILSAWRVSNSAHLFQGIYFTDPNAPVELTVLRPGDIVVVCVTDGVTGPP